MSTGSLSRPASAGRTALSRITLVGERRRVDLVLPSRESIGVLLPEALRLLDDRVGERPEPRHLVLPDGTALALDSTLESAGVPDGAVLRLVRVADAPSAPVVHDVSDEAADDLDVRAGRWGPIARRVVAGCATVLFALVAGLLAGREFFAAGDAGAGAVTAAGLCAVAGVLCGRARQWS
ncbi:EsaB/YukD family protein, partial [Streptomyces sp. TRM76130]|nr:EsaB/YukD family protein [Streptomyces sp. TRM76130]